jgi:hypothetical protein
MFICARVIAGLGLGFINSIVPPWISELAKVKKLLLFKRFSKRITLLLQIILLLLTSIRHTTEELTLQ